MGWSCTAAADEKMRLIQKRYMNNSNFWEHKGRKFFYEIGREQDDGSITGSIYEDFGDTCRRAGAFKINPDGSINRFPFLEMLRV